MFKYKLYYDKEAEQDWINKMANLGWRLDSFFLGRYTFSPCEPGTYSYQIDLLDSCFHERSEYNEFMNDAGVKVVCQWYKWTYLEKRTSDGSCFELYTDVDSKIEHYSKIKKLFVTLLVIELIVAILEFIALYITGQIHFLFLTLLIGTIVVALARAVIKYNQILERYKLDIGMQ